GLVRAGLRTGRLGEVLGRYARFDRIGADLQRSLWWHLAYPLLLLSALVGLYLFIAAVVMRDFEAILQDFGIAIPGITRTLIQLSHAVHRMGWGLLAVPLGMLFLLWLGSRGLLGESRRGRVANRLPLIGPLWRWSALAEFAHLLGLLIESEVPLVEALPMAGEGIEDPDLADATRQMAREIEAGQPLAETLGRYRVVPSGAVKILEWSEAQQALPEALRLVGETFEARARAQAAFVGIFSLVVAVVLTLAGLLYLLVALYWPLYQIYELVQKMLL
ncbi:MAG: type II secretion system F family protein, partial [Isosphaeraceae bacterium]|nr:type II secretion system F family protein [Isosphaeraceae bacterium]